MPTPTCTQQKSVEIRCLCCGDTMRLSSIEPGAPNFELLRYFCSGCDTEECLLVAITPPQRLRGTDRLQGQDKIAAI
jgi:hypothetical protein